MLQTLETFIYPTRLYFILLLQTWFHDIYVYVYATFYYLSVFQSWESPCCLLLYTPNLSWDRGYPVTPLDMRVTAMHEPHNETVWRYPFYFYFSIFNTWVDLPPLFHYPLACSSRLWQCYLSLVIPSNSYYDYPDSI